MFWYDGRVSLLRVIGLLAIGYLVINAIGGAVATGIGAALFLSFFVFKLLLLLMLFKMVVGFAGHGRGFGPRWPRFRRTRSAAERTEEQTEFDEFVRKARERLDDLYPRD